MTIIKHDWMKSQGHFTQISLYIQPGASKSEVSGLFGDPARLKIKIKAPPRDGEANKEVIEFISKILGISKSKIEIIRGETSRQKDLLIDIPLEQIALIFEKLLESH